MSGGLGDIDVYLIGEGTHRRLYDVLGAHFVERDGTRGVRFAVWAPNARRVSVVGDFNHWDARAIRCASALRRACGRRSSRALGPERSTSSRSSGRMGTAFRSRPIRWRVSSEMRPATASIVLP